MVLLSCISLPHIPWWRSSVDTSEQRLHDRNSQLRITMATAWIMATPTVTT